MKCLNPTLLDSKITIIVSVQFFQMSDSSKEEQERIYSMLERLQTMTRDTVPR